MGAITPTKVSGLDASAGTKKLKTFTVVPASASDTIDLSAYFSSIGDVFAVLTAGVDAALQTCYVTVSGTTVTIITQAAGGTAATNWTGAGARLLVIGEDEGL